MTDDFDFDFDFDVDRGRSASRTESSEPEEASDTGEGREPAERGNGSRNGGRNGSRSNGSGNGNGARRYASRARDLRSRGSSLIYRDEEDESPGRPEEGDWLSIGDEDFTPGSLSG